MTLAPNATATIALYVDLFREAARATAGLVASTLRDAGYSIALCEDQNRELGLSTGSAQVEDAFVLVTIGGDGTLLRAAQIAVPIGLPLFGINSGHLGFLTELEATPKSIAALPAILRDGMTIEERAVLRATVHGRSYLALNDIVMKRAGTAHMSPFGIFIDGKEAAHVPADGIVVSTPTGSTAYSLSAGGPILEPSVAGFAVVALAPHTLFARPLVVSESATITLVADPETQRASLEADGRLVEDLMAGDAVSIVRNPQRVRFARRAPLNFFSLLEEKLRWNAPIKNGAGNESG